MSDQEKPNLPVVSKTVIDVHHRDFNQSTAQRDFISKQFEKFTREQPNLAQYVFSFIELRTDGDKETYSKMATVALVMYELLARQAESESMEALVQLNLDM